MVDELASGPCVVVEISSKDEDTVTAFREFCGPADPVSFLTLRLTNSNFDYDPQKMFSVLVSSLVGILHEVFNVFCDVQCGLSKLMQQ